MDTHALVTEKEIEIGRKVLEILSADSELNVRAALWVYNDNLGQWLFTISSKFYEKRGAQIAYLRVRTLLEKNALLERMPLDRVAIVADNDPVLELVRVAINLQESFLINCMVNSTLLPDMYIYRIAKRTAGTRKKTTIAQ